jgi:phosphatidate cytidylyltransferase
MKNLLVRTASGIVFVVLMAACILWNQYSYMVLFTFILVGSLLEYYNITGGQQSKGSNKISAKWFVVIFSVLVFLKSFLLSSAPATGTPNFDNLLVAFLQGLARLRDSGISMNGTVPLFMFLLFIYELFNRSEKPFENIGWNLVAVVWILIPLVLTNNLYFAKGGAFLLSVFFLIWVYDSASYAVGSLIGKHKLYERISPKKTVEGMLGGIVFTLGFAWFFNNCKLLASLSRLEWELLAVVIIFAATFGDLVESLLKRSLQLKDSGSIMPGHGGFLDRFDAYFLTVPFVICALWMITQIHNMLLIVDYLSK